MATDKFKKAITWIRKTLEITEKTTQPGTVSGTILPTIEALGWERLGERLVGTNTGAANVNSVNGPVTPADVLRLVLHAQAITDDPAIIQTMWLEVQFANNLVVGVTQGVVTPILLAAGEAIPVVLPRPLFLRERDFLRARATPGTGVGANLNLMMMFVDIPVGEYIPGVGP